MEEGVDNSGVLRRVGGWRGEEKVVGELPHG